MNFTVDSPAKLPVSHLSVSSIDLFISCPEKWKRRYLDGEYFPPNGKMVLGSAIHASEAQHYGRVIDGEEGFTTEQVIDEFSAEWNERISRGVDWGDDNPGELKDSGIAALRVYHDTVVPTIEPVAVEREFRISWEGVDWDLMGFIDLECADGAVADLKVGKKLSPGAARVALQPTAYLYVRRAEANPAPRFDYHQIVRGNKKPSATVMSTTRTDEQLDYFAERLFSIAQDMAWRTETGNWAGAVPGSWFCDPKWCPHWDGCLMRGML
jgi:hypothetical protein